MEDTETIGVRITRLNNLILGQSDSAKCTKELSDGLSREGLLDGLFVLYEECSKDAMKKKDKNITDFISKCKLSL